MASSSDLDSSAIDGSPVLFPEGRANDGYLVDNLMTLVNSKLKWNGDFEAFKTYVLSTLSLNGKWTSPGGSTK